MKKQAEKEIEMTPEIMDKIHQCGQEILDVFVQICKENNLRYYLIAGTLLGAVRHKGPIPWDDDIDVCMPRADMEKFKEIMLARPEGETYHIHCFENDPNLSIFLIRLTKKDTLYNTQRLTNINARFRELWIDIFPLDSVISNKSFQYKLLGMHINILKKIIGSRVVKDQSVRSLKGCLIYCFIKHFSVERLHNKTDKLMQKWNDADCDYYVSWASHYHFLKQTMPKDWYEPAGKLMYSGKYYYVPNKWDKVLTQLYGDYMKVPPEKKRIGHSAIEIKF